MQEATLRKVSRRLIPFIALLYAFNILDRTNISVAALSMKPDLGFSDTVYGLGAGVFFLGYFLFEVPSNLILERVGARKWIARILVTWGVAAAALSPNAYCTLAALTVAEFGRGIVQGPFWAMPTSLLSGAAAAGGIAAINSIGNLGGFAGPYAMGWLKDRTHGYQTGLFLLAGLLIGSAISALLVPTKPESKDR
jgi:MFS family permease